MSATRPYRNRNAKILPRQVELDSLGNIVRMPPTPNLDCFGDPVEYERGVFSTPHIFVRNGTRFESPRDCFGCQSRATCGMIADQRVKGDTRLAELHDTWSNETCRLGHEARYQHPTFRAFADACADRAWTSTNEAALEKKRQADRKRQRRARAQQKAKGRRCRSVTPEFEAALEEGYSKRLQALTDAARDPTSGPWLRKLNDRSIHFTCDTWKMHELLKWRHKKAATGADIARQLILADQSQGRGEHALRTRVSEARRRIDRLEDETSGLAAWQPFQVRDSELPRAGGHKLHADLVWKELDDFVENPSILSRAN